MRKSSFLVMACALMANEAFAQQHLTATDLPQMHATYEANQARFMRDFKGRWFAATLPFERMTENPFMRGRYTITFGKGAFMGDISCNLSDKKLIDRATNYNKGEIIGLRGIVEDHVMGSVVLKECDFN